MMLEEFIGYCKAHKEIYCFGAGQYGRVIRSFLVEQGIELKGFIVSKKEINTETVLDIPVYPAEMILSDIVSSKESVGIIIGISDKYRYEVEELLIKYGIYDTFSVNDDLVKMMKRQCRFDSKYDVHNNITVFIYHRVADLPLDTWKLAVKPEIFDRQIKYIKENYTVLRGEEEWHTVGNKPAAVITFDDGYEDSYTNALPILEKYDVPATVFVCSGNIDTTDEFWWDELERVIYFADNSQLGFEMFGEQFLLLTDTDKERTCYRLHPYLKKMEHEARMHELSELAGRLRSLDKREYCHSMSSSQLNALSRSGLITIGGHTVTHSCMASEAADVQKWEIEKSKRDIESIIGKKLEIFSYPFGQPNDYKPQTIRLCSEAGYRRIFAAYEGLTNVNYQNGYIPRVNIGQEKDYTESIRKLKYYTIIYGDDAV